MGFSNYEIVKGDIEETLKDYENLNICFSCVDLNFYRSTKAALTFLEKTLSKGGLIFEDDYEHIDGVTLAYNESCFIDADIAVEHPGRFFTKDLTNGITM